MAGKQRAIGKEMAKKRKLERTALIPIRVKPEEKEMITKKAEAAELSVSEYLRSLANGATITPRRKRAYLRDPAFAEYTRQLARIGNNLNQLARWANAEKTTIEAVRITAHLVAIEEAIEHVHQNFSIR